MLKLLKFVVQAVLIEEDEDGNVVGEHVGETTVAYGVEQLRDVGDAVVAAVAKHNAGGEG